MLQGNKHMNLMKLFSNLPITTVEHYFEEILFYVQSFQKRQ